MTATPAQLPRPDRVSQRLALGQCRWCQRPALDGEQFCFGHLNSYRKRGGTALRAVAPMPEPERRTRSAAQNRSRSARKRDVRAITISCKRTTKAELEAGRLLYPETDYWKPRTRADCFEVPRPCPYVSCKHHLFLDVSLRTGSVKLNFPDLEVWEMGESCALDIADREGQTLEQVAALTNLTRERVRQLELIVVAKLLARGNWSEG